MTIGSSHQSFHYVFPLDVILSEPLRRIFLGENNNISALKSTVFKMANKTCNGFFPEIAFLEVWQTLGIKNICTFT